MSYGSFNEAVNKRIDDLKKANREAMNIGDKHTYQCNCNELKGMSHVMDLLKQHC